MFVLNGQLLSPFEPSYYFFFTLHRRENWTEMMGVVAGSSNLSSRQRAVCCYSHRWPLGLSTSTSVFHWCVFFCPSVLCFDQCGFTKTRKERTRRVGLHYHTSVWHKEGRTKVWFAGALYGSSTVSLHYDFNGKEVWTRYQSQAHTICAQRTRIMQPLCRWTTQMVSHCVSSTLLLVRGKLPV